MPNHLSIVPLGGGSGQVTKNMFVYQWGNEAIVIDCGIGFPEDKVSEEVLIPDISYLKRQRLKIHAFVITHGHDDHYAALPHVLPQLGSIPVYASRLAAGFIEDRFREYNLKYKLSVFEETDHLQLGPFSIDPIYVTHSVPDSYHFMIQTPVGNIYHGSDFKFDLTPVDQRLPNFKKIVSLSQAKTLCLLSDCLRSERPGFTPSETTLTPAIERESSHWPGRLIFTTVSSQIHRIQQAVNVALSFKRKIIFVGQSMKRNVQIAQRLGFLKKLPQRLLKVQAIKKIPDARLCLIVAGSQGQESSSLTRYASGTHKFLKVKPSDKVIYSADIIPGNEPAVYRVIDQLAKHGVYVAHGELIDDLHASGHASAAELQLLMSLVKPQYLYPIGGNFRHQRQYQRLGQQLGFKNEQIILPQTGQVVEFSRSGQVRLGETLKLKEIRFLRQ